MPSLTLRIWERSWLTFLWTHRSVDLLPTHRFTRGIGDSNLTFPLTVREAYYRESEVWMQ